MPIRSIKKLLDRGSLADLVKKQDEFLEPPSEEELRLKKLYEIAESTNNEELKKSLGFIVMPNAGNRDALPISVYRHKEYVNSLSSSMRDKIEKTKQELMQCFSDHYEIGVRKNILKQEIVRNAILQEPIMVKVAGVGAICVDVKRSFRRVKQ